MAQQIDELGRTRWLDNLRTDLGYGVRSLRRSAGLSSVMVAILTLGLGATLTMYVTLRDVVLRPLDFTRPDELLSLGVASSRDHTVTAGLSAAEFQEWRAQSRSLASLAAYRMWGFELDGASEPERVVGARVSANLFSMLGVQPLRGRVFAPNEDQAGAPPVAVLSDSLWHAAFAGDTALVGRTVSLNGAPYTVIGVVGARAMQPRAALWVPYTFAPYELAQRGDRSVSVIARRDANASLERVRADLSRVMRDEATRFPDTALGWEPTVQPLRDAVLGSSTEALTILFVATCVLLLVSCVNTMNALLVRLVTRRRELAIRSAVGASMHRLFQQLLTEAALLVFIGGVGAVAISEFALRWLGELGPEYIPRPVALHVDVSAVAVATLLTMSIALAMSIGAAAALQHMQLGETMKSRALTARGKRFSARDLFVAVQVALASALLIDGWLLVMSLRNMQAVHLGFDPHGVVTATVSLPNSRYGTAAARAAFFHEVETHAAHLPGVEIAAIASRVPFAASAGGGVASSIRMVGQESRTNLPRAGIIVVSPDYFETIRVNSVSGRLFDDSDRSDTPPVVIVDDILARQLAPRGDVVGSLIRLDSTTGGDTAARRIVGVVRETRMVDPTQPPTPLIYLPYAQSAWPTMNVLIRGVRDAPTASDVRRVLHEVDPSRPVYNVRTLEVALRSRLALRRLQTRLLAGFAITALMLALVGAHGVTAFTVRQREREFGIRIAVGATPRQIMVSVLREALHRITVGAVFGIALAVFAGNVLRHAVFGVSPWDPVAMAVATAVVCATAIGANLAPAVRAARADPSTALRAE